MNLESPKSRISQLVYNSFLWSFYIHITASIQKDDIHFTSSDKIVEVTLRFAHLYGDIASHPVIDLIFTWLQTCYSSDLDFHY